jgi:hypothetical protein
MRSRSRLLAGFAAAALLLTACGEGDATRDELIEMLSSPGEPGAENLTEAEATCIADRLFDRLDQDQINAIARPAEELSAGSRQIVIEASQECVDRPTS